MCRSDASVQSTERETITSTENENDHDEAHPQISSDHVNPDEDECVLFVGDIPGGITEEEVMDLFGPYGELISVQMRPSREARGSNDRKFAFIRFSSKDAAAAAFETLSTNGVTLQGSALRVGKARKNRRLIFENVPVDVNEADFQLFLDRFAGAEPDGVTFFRSSHPGAPCSAVVVYESREMAKVAKEGLHGQHLKGMPVFVDWYRSPRIGSSEAGANGTSDHGNLSGEKASATFGDRGFHGGRHPVISLYIQFETVAEGAYVNEESLKDLFEPYGVVTGVYLKSNFTSSSGKRQYGYAFVHFESSEAGAASALRAAEAFRLTNGGAPTNVNGVSYRCEVSKNYLRATGLDDGRVGDGVNGENGRKSRSSSVSHEINGRRNNGSKSHQQQQQHMTSGVPSLYFGPPMSTTYYSSNSSPYSFSDSTTSRPGDLSARSDPGMLYVPMPTVLHGNNAGYAPHHGEYYAPTMMTPNLGDHSFQQETIFSSPSGPSTPQQFSIAYQNHGAPMQMIVPPTVYYSPEGHPLMYGQFSPRVVQQPIAPMGSVYSQMAFRRPPVENSGTSLPQRVRSHFELTKDAYGHQPQQQQQHSPRNATNGSVPSGAPLTIHHSLDSTVVAQPHQLHIQGSPSLNPGYSIVDTNEVPAMYLPQQLQQPVMVPSHYIAHPSTHLPYQPYPANNRVDGRMAAVGVKIPSMRTPLPTQQQQQHPGYSPPQRQLPSQQLLPPLPLPQTYSPNGQALPYSFGNTDMLYFNNDDDGQES